MEWLGKTWTRPRSCDPTNGPSGCTAVTLDTDGALHWTTLEEGTGRVDVASGPVRFSCDPSGRALAWLDEGVLPWSVVGGALSFADQTLFALDPAAEDATSLPDFDPSRTVTEPSYCKLVASDWKKANAFDLEVLPDAMHFDRNGTSVWSYRGGDCEHGGTWGILNGGFVGIDEAQQCDPRFDVPQVVTRSQPLAWIDDVLVLLDAYVPADADQDEKQRVALADDTVSVLFSFAEEWRTGEAAPIEMRLLNRGATDTIDSPTATVSLHGGDDGSVESELVRLVGLDHAAPGAELTLSGQLGPLPADGLWVVWSVEFRRAGKTVTLRRRTDIGEFFRVSGDRASDG